MRYRSLLCLAVLISLSAVFAAPFEGEIRSLREIASMQRGFLSELEGLASEAGEVASRDLPAMRKWLETLADGYDEAAKAFESNNPDEGRRMWGALDGRSQERSRWRERMEFRMRQQRLAPLEGWVAEVRNNLSPEVLPAFEQFVEARKSASEAFGRAADATSPGADKHVMRDAVFAARDAEIEAEISERRFNWTNETRELLKDRDLSPELQQKYAEMEKLQNELDQLQRDREQLDRKIRSIHDRRSAVVGAARAAREAAIRGKSERK